METFSTKLPIELITKVKEYAKAHGMKIWCVVAEALSNYFKGERTLAERQHSQQVISRLSAVTIGAIVNLPDNKQSGYEA